MQFWWLSATRRCMEHPAPGTSQQNLINCTNADVRLELLMMGTKTAGTCRAVISIKMELGAFVGFIHKASITMHSHTVIKYKFKSVKITNKIYITKCKEFLLHKHVLPDCYQRTIFSLRTNFSEICVRGETFVRSSHIFSNTQNKCTSNYFWKTSKTLNFTDYYTPINALLCIILVWNLH
jgi:hypothetical protein